ncbi:MAG: site-specific integrase [bacterium]|nr:site-specific integrase [bacterium]
MFNKGKEWGKASDNPVTKVKLFKENNKRIRYLELKEIKSLLDVCSKHLKPIVITALNTGMRKGEILGLKWKDLDFKQDFIYLEHTKNNELREIPMNKVLKDTLLSIEKNPLSEYVFCDKDGSSFKEVKRSFGTAMKKAGIKDFRFHDLRHTFASHLVMNGIDLLTVKELLGHKSIEMTLRYAHLSPNHKRRAVELLGAKMCEQVDTFWTPEPKDSETENEGVGEIPLYINGINNCALSSVGLERLTTNQ